MSLWKVFWAAGVTIITFAVMAQANILSNGGFENGFDLDQAESLGTAIVASVSSQGSYVQLAATTELPDRADWYRHPDHGRTGYFIEFQTGTLAGQRAFITDDISTSSGTADTLSYEPLAGLPSAGDQFRIYSAMPTGWNKSTQYFDTRQPISREIDNVKFGTAALRIDNWGYNKEIAQVINVQAGVEYVLTYYIASSSTSSVNVGAIIRNNSTGAILENDRATVAAANTYEKRTITFTPASSMAIQLEIGFSIVSTANDTHILIDSVTFESSDNLTVRDNLVTMIHHDPDGMSYAYAAYKFNYKLDTQTGAFIDVNYNPTVYSSVSWSPHNHLLQLLGIVRAWTDPDSAYYQQASWRDGIINAYNYWVDNDFQHPYDPPNDWWFDDHCVPRDLSKIMMLLQKCEALPQYNFDDAVAIIHRSYARQSAMTGINTVWLARITLNEGIIRYLETSDTTECEDAIDLYEESLDNICGTIDFSDFEGVNVDYSYLFHYRLLYNGGYGEAWLENISEIAAVVGDTSYELPDADVQQIVDFILDGQQWMIRGNEFDQSTVGRNRSRSSNYDHALDLFEPLDDIMSVSGTYRQSELEDMYDRLEYAETNSQANLTDDLSGNRYYWRADYMVHRRPEYFVSVKTVSPNTETPEYCGGEDAKALYAHDGVTMIMRTGNEYECIQPVWDWYRLPGTTTETYVDYIPWLGYLYDITPTPTSDVGDSPWAGGVSDGTYGANGMYYINREVTAKKAWFFFDDEFVALGADIRAPWADWRNLVKTTVNQTLLNGDVTYSTVSGGTTTLSTDMLEPTGLEWVHHDSVGYVLFTPADNVMLRAQEQTGSWYDINPNESNTGIVADVFSMDINHGNRPNNGLPIGSYAYIVVPGVTANETDTYYQNIPVSILSNTATVQAVRHNTLNITQGIFHDMGSFTVNGSFTFEQLTDNIATAVMIKINGSQLTLSVASMDRYESTATFRINMHLSGTGASWNGTYTTLTFNLPDDEDAGSTMTLTYNIY